MEIKNEKSTEKKNITSSLAFSTKKWYFLDLTDKTLGRIAPLVVAILRGKNKRNFLANADMGDCVILTNTEKVNITGNLDKKHYYNYSGYPGGMRKRSTRTMLEEYPVELTQRVIKGMMPHNKLGSKQLKRLFVYRGSEHSQQAQEKHFINIKI